MSLLVPPETVLQRFVHDVLHASVRRRVHLDPSLQKIFHTEVGVAGFELLKITRPAPSSETLRRSLTCLCESAPRSCVANVGLATCQWRRRVLHHVPVDSFPTLVLLYSECGVDAERSAGECFRVSANTIGFACRRIALHLVCAARDSVGHVVADVLTFAGELVNRLTDTGAGLLILFGGPLPKTRRRIGDSLAKL